MAGLRSIRRVAGVIWLIPVFLMCLGAQSDAPAQTFKGPQLGVASRFGQSWQPEILAAARLLPALNFRDEIYWRRIEYLDGQFAFTQNMTTYPDRLLAHGATLSLIIAGTHPDYDNGQTPHTPGAVAAFARMASRLAVHFPTVRSLEIGNEFNSQDFVSGPVQDADIAARAGFFNALLKEVYTRAKAENPEIRIIGGAALGIPAGFLTHVFEAGGANYMDALALHPNTTHSEQLVRQIDVVRRINGAATIPIEITEFGDPDPLAAAARLLKGHCQLALSGVSRIVWYPLSDRGDGMTPLLGDDHTLTPVGQAYRFIQHQLVGEDVQNASADPFTYGCFYGPDKLVLWGETRNIKVSDGVAVFTAEGRKLPANLAQLSMRQPLVFLSQQPIVWGRDVVLSEQPILADSYHQFAYPRDDQRYSNADGFTRFARRQNRDVPLVTHPGQTGPGTMWTPSLADPGDGFVRLTAQSLRPAGSESAPVEVVHLYRSEINQTVDVSALFAPRSSSEDGVKLTVWVNGEIVETRIIKAAYRFVRMGHRMKAGDRIEFSIGPNGTANGDVTDYRITILNSTTRQEIDAPFPDLILSRNADGT